MGKKDRKKKRKPPPRRKPRPSDFAAAVNASNGKPRPPAAAQASRLLRRLRSIRVATSEDEHPADIAVCQPRNAEQRDPEWAADVDLIREALQLVASGRDEQARNTLRRIPRRSPLSQWRLFLSGLSDWYAGDAEQAESAWQRLDLSRRPARIAAVLRTAGSSAAGAGNDAGAGDADAVPAGEGTTASAADASSAHAAPPLDEATLENRAALVRSLRVSRPAIQELAEATSRRASPDQGEKFPFPLVAWMISWRATYRAYEPELVAAAQRNALALAFNQPEAPVFDRLAKNLPGPPHDPKNRLYLSQYLDKFLGAEDESEKCREAYLRQDLPRCEELSKPTRAAIESLLHLQEARESQSPPARSMFSMLMSPPDTREAEDAYKAAIKAYPTNRTAHREYVELLRHANQPHRDTKKDEEARNLRIRRVMERWSKSLPDDIEPRLWLVNHYLANEELEPAQPHVEMLQRQRLQDPRVRSLPWRWALFESMRLARHKRRVDQAREQLEQAESLWPEWLSPTWLPFLRAALAWRAGETETYQRLRDEAEAAVGRFPLVSNIMLFAAARWMHVPSGELKALRQTITDLTNDRNAIDTRDLLKTGSFLWDLDRTDMFYTGYRTHAPPLCEEVAVRLSASEIELPDEPIGPAALWCAGSRFACDTYRLYVPHYVDEQKTSDPLVGASLLRAITELRFEEKRVRSERETYEFVKSAAETTRDPFYRHYFQTLVDGLAPHLAPPAGATRFDQEDDDEVDRFWDDDEDDDEWDGEEELCNCINCRRARGELGPEEVAEEASGPVDPAEEIMREMFDQVVGMLDPDRVEQLRQMGLFDESDDDANASAGQKRKKTKKR